MRRIRLPAILVLTAAAVGSVALTEMQRPADAGRDSRRLQFIQHILPHGTAPDDSTGSEYELPDTLVIEETLPEGEGPIGIEVPSGWDVIPIPPAEKPEPRIIEI
jgi:hypothetical protein